MSRRGLVVEREVDRVQADGIAAHDHVQQVGPVDAVVVAREGGIDRVVDRDRAGRTTAPERHPRQAGRVEQLVLLQRKVHLHACTRQPHTHVT
jgi:hypothetical protein